jgi:hypothetical protein
MADPTIPREALQVGIGDVRAAAELGQEDGQLGCRQAQLVEKEQVLGLAPSRRNTRRERLAASVRVTSLPAQAGLRLNW